MKILLISDNEWVKESLEKYLDFDHELTHEKENTHEKQKVALHHDHGDGGFFCFCFHLNCMRTPARVLSA